MINHRFLSILRTFKLKPIFPFAQIKKVAGPNLNQDFSQIFAGDKKQITTSGRAWKTQQLRLKSNEDLHKLWFVCVKEKNILLADQVVQKKFNENSTLASRIEKVKKTMNRILGVVREREQIKKQYRKKLEDQYIEKKKQELKENLAKKEEELPEITWQMLREKYMELRKGVDNVRYLERIWSQKQTADARRARMIERLKTNKPKNFKSFWQYEMAIGQRPLQQQVLRAHIKNWKALNLKQRKIILGFLNAKRAKDAKATFLKQLRILGDKIAQDQVKARIQSSAAAKE